MKATFDSNILVYAADSESGDKHLMAADLLRRAGNGDCLLTLQALGEFFYVVTRKAKCDPADAQGMVEVWRAVFPVFPADEGCLIAAMAAVGDHGLPFWDAMIWAAARRAGCRLLFTEDFQDGRTLGGVTFVNPFEDRNATLLGAALAPPRGG
ncbi:MAG: PIN domain-containing protein [Rhodospirillales bacterium]|nr:PIN domain-containing protein [Rhodospirillales bacterium]